MMQVAIHRDRNSTTNIGEFCSNGVLTSGTSVHFRNRRHGGEGCVGFGTELLMHMHDVLGISAQASHADQTANNTAPTTAVPTTK